MTGTCCSSCAQGGPCEPPTSTRTLTVVQQADAEEERSIVVWGPMSAEILSRSGHLVRVGAVEKALPMLLRRGGATLKHKSDIVGHFLPQIDVDPEHVPGDPKVRAMIEEVTGEYGALPSAVLTVTPAIAAVFPRLKPLLGDKVPFLATEVFGGDRYQTKVRNDILAGRLDSYSIDAPLYDVDQYEKCDEFGCITIQDVRDLELTGTTLCSSTPPRGGEEGATAMNPGAGFVVVQQAETGTPIRLADEPGKDSYPDAGTSAPPEVQEAVKRLKSEGDPDTPLLYQVLGSGTPPYKMGKQDAEYRERPRGDEACGNCEFAYKKVGRERFICSQVRGDISLGAWCRLWAPQEQEETRQADRAIQEYVDVAGVRVGVEHPKGSTRTGTSPDGEWSRTMKHHYGRILGQPGADGDMLDAYVGPDPESDLVFVIDQVTKDGGFDEHKVMLGFSSKEEAVAGYRAHYPDDWEVGPVTSMSTQEFRSLLEDGFPEGALVQADSTQLVVPVANGESLFFRDADQCRAWASELAGVDPDAFCEGVMARQSGGLRNPNNGSSE